MKRSNPDPMVMEAVIRAMSTVLRTSIQRQVTGLFVSSRKWTSPLSATSVTCRNTYYRSPGYQEPAWPPYQPSANPGCQVKVTDVHELRHP